MNHGRTALFLGLLLFCVTRSQGQEYPPPGFELVDSQESPRGGFKLVHYKRDPNDFSSESQIWLEPIESPFTRQLLFTHHNRSYWRIDDDDSHIAIGHHANSNDNFVWIFVREPNGHFRQVKKELRNAALKVLCAKLGVQKTPTDFDHFDCYAEAWLSHGILLAYLRGDSRDRNFYLNPWYFFYDTDHDRFLWDISESNRDAFVVEKRK